MKAYFFHQLELHYTFTGGVPDLIFFFMVYSFLGWLLENSYSFFTGNGFFKPIFLRGPFKPMYGIAPVFLIVLITDHMNGVLIALICFLIPTIVEFMSGALLNRFFQRKWWDYTDMPLQFCGHICLPFSICWLFLSYACLKWIHPVVATIYNKVEPYWMWMYPIIVIYFFLDLLFAIKKNASFVISTQ